MSPPDALTLDADEPARIGDAVAKLGLRHVVITSVDRDDLDDGGAQHFADTIHAIRKASPETSIEILTPDFLRKEARLKLLLRRVRMCSITIWKLCRVFISASGRARYFHSIPSFTARQTA